MSSRDLQLLVFTSPYCAGCKKLINDLNKLNLEYKEYDVENGGMHIANYYGVRGLPTLIVLEKNEVKFYYVGYPGKGKIEKMLNPFLTKGNMNG